jgi:NAD(P)-dependent dehydrogenase (short-subunit alcohol dehydrogenase family)
MRQRILIIGANGLIGSQVAKKLIENNIPVLLADIAYKNNIKNDFDQINIDITSEKSINDIIKSNQITGVVNVAYPRTENYKLTNKASSYDNFSSIVGTHIGGFYMISRIFGEYFASIGGGVVINFASIYGAAVPKFNIYSGADDVYCPVEYAASKAAVIQLTKYYAGLHIKNNVRFNVISPGGIYNGHSDKFVASYGAYTINDGMLTPNDVSGLVLFLISSNANNITGQNLVVDGGFTL